MPFWFLRLGWGLCLLVCVGALGVSIATRSFDTLREVPFFLVLAALLMLVERGERGKDLGVRDARQRVCAIGAGIGAVVVAHVTPWGLDTPWMPVGLFFTLFFALLSIVLGILYARGRPA